MTPLGSVTDSRICLGTADLVSRREALRTVSLPNASIAGAHVDSASYSADVVTSSWAMSDLELGIGGAVFGAAESAEEHLRRRRR